MRIPSRFGDWKVKLCGISIFPLIDRQSVRETTKNVYCDGRSLKFILIDGLIDFTEEIIF